MKRILSTAICVVGCVSILYRAALGDCTPFTKNGPTIEDGTSAGCGENPGADGAPNFPPLVKIESRTIAWPDGYKLGVTATSKGECRLYQVNCYQVQDLPQCRSRRPELERPNQLLL